jgi:hypothetical protein
MNGAMIPCPRRRRNGWPAAEPTRHTPTLAAEARRKRRVRLAGRETDRTLVPTAAVPPPVTSAKLMTSATGTITIVFTAPATLLTSGTDTLNAGNTATAPTISATDSYTF